MTVKTGKFKFPTEWDDWRSSSDSRR